MDKSTIVVAGLLLGGTLALSACGGNQRQDADPSGIYEGLLTDNVTGQTSRVMAIIDERGYGRVGAANGTYYQLNLGTSGNELSGNLVGFSNNGNFPNGSTITQGSIAGSVTNFGLQINYAAQGNDSGSLSLNFDNVYDNPSSLPTLAGNWGFSDSSSGYSLNLTIQPNGSFTGSDSYGCFYTGAFNLIDTRFNAYGESYTLSCNGGSAGYSGLATFLPASGTLPAAIGLLADDNGGGFLYVTVNAQ